MALLVRLQVFEGPLDLLLHLIDKNKVDIYDIPIFKITEQYLEYVRALESKDMNVMSEFMVMASTLINIKCKMLLPKQVNEDGEEEDPRAELVQQLLEHKMYKYMSYELKDRHIDAGRAVFKGSSMPKDLVNVKPPIDYDELIGDVTLKKLNDIFKSILQRQEDRVDPIRSKFGNLKKDEISLTDKQNHIFDYISSHSKCSFKELLEAQDSKLEIIVSFLVVLELMKVGQVTISQDNLFDDIIISRTDENTPIGLSPDFAIV